MNIVDCRGMACPKPVITAKSYFDQEDNTAAEVLVDNEVAKNNLIKFAENKGYAASVKLKDSDYHVYISKDSNLVAIKASTNENNTEDFTLVISSDKLGEGEDKLGLTLMKSYLFALSESEVLPKKIIFMNSGVKLPIEGSDCLESLKKLEGRGCSILSCGTCLDFYNLKDKLSLGEITNMYTIVEEMNKAAKTIKL